MFFGMGALLDILNPFLAFGVQSAAGSRNEPVGSKFRAMGLGAIHGCIGVSRKCIGDSACAAPHGPSQMSSGLEDLAYSRI